jgi:uncharacterized protein YndB with AHSA1/START domain
MTNNTVNETERMTIIRVFDAPRELVWKAWTDPKYIMQWWGPKGFTAPVCKMDFRVGGKLLCCMKAPDGQEGWNAVEYHEIVPYEKIVSLMYFSDPEGNKIDPAQLGIEPEAIEGAYDVTLFEDLGNGQTKLTFIGNEPMESAKNSGQLEGCRRLGSDEITANLTPSKTKGSSRLNRNFRAIRNNESLGPCGVPAVSTVHLALDEILAPTRTRLTESAAGHSPPLRP